MTDIFCSSVINWESVIVSESGQNGIITRWGQKGVYRHEVVLSIFINNSRACVSLRCFSDSTSAYVSAEIKGMPIVGLWIVLIVLLWIDSIWSDRYVGTL